MKKIICWALFDSETGDYMSVVKKYFSDEINIYGVGMSYYGKDTDNYVKFDLANFSELFDRIGIAKKLLKILPQPDIIVASPPCESWGHLTSINNGNIHWKRYASKLFPENKIFQLQDVDVSSRFIKNIGIRTFYTRINGELCHQNTWEIIKTIRPKVFLVENPDNYCWEYIHKYVSGGLPKMHLNKLVYSAYDSKNFSPKKEIFASNIKLKLRRLSIVNNGNSVKASHDLNKNVSKNYSTRSKIPELALVDFFEQAIKWIKHNEKTGRAEG
jgi:hypothetical protein